MINTVLFDKDGTLVDTEKHYLTAYFKAFEQCGHPILLQQALGMRSLGMPYVKKYVDQICGSDEAWEELRISRRKIFEELIKEHTVEAKPYLKESLAMLKEHGFKTAVVTATSYSSAEYELGKVGVFDMFDYIVTTDMVKRGKPAPDVYEYACKKLGIAPDEAVAVEDSPNGVISAYLSGCNVVMIPDQTHPDETLRPMLYACKSNLLELAEFLCG